MTERTARVAAPAALALFALLGVLMTSRPLGVALAAWAVVLVTGVALAWRRTTGWPLAVAFLVPVAATVVLGAAQSSNLAWMGLCVLAAWVALTSSTAVVVASGVVLELTLAAQWLPQTEEAGWAAWVVGTGFSLVACVFSQRLRRTVEDLGRAQVQLAERSRAEERTRIAAEVHDVIGHALTVSLLHISSARLALDEEPEEARRSLEEAERLARDSLEEVRATVGLVRADTAVRTAPLPGADQVPELVASFRRAGARVELTVAGDLAGLRPARGLVVYRVLQEALTNATRHAPGEPVRVQVTVEDGTATVAVRNGGPGDPAARPGSGLAGMRERVEGVGGRLRAGTQGDVGQGDGGRPGWLVEAVLPT